MKKYLPAKLAILVLLISAFFAYNAYARWKSTHFTVNSKSFHVVRNYQSLINDQKKFSSKLSLAYQYHLLKNINRTITLPNIRRKITIHKMWYNAPNLYVLYSVNLHKSDQLPSDVPKINFTNLIFHSTKNKTVKTGIMKMISTNTQKAYQSVVYRHELYRGILLRPVPTNGDSIQLQNMMPHLSQIDLTGGTLIDHDKKPKTLDQLKMLSYSYHTKDNVLFSKKLNQTIKLNHGVDLNFTKWKATLFSKSLYFTTNQSKQLPDFIFVKSNFYNQSSKKGHPFFQTIIRTPIFKSPEGKAYILSLYPEQSSISQIKLTFIKTVKYRKGIVLRIPSAARAGDKIGKVYGCNFYYGGVKKISPLKDELIIKWDIPSKGQSTNHLGHLNVLTKAEFHNLSKQMILRNDYTILSIENEKGKLPSQIQSYGEMTEGKYNILSVILDHSFVQGAKTLDVSFN